MHQSQWYSNRSRKGEPILLCHPAGVLKRWGRVLEWYPTPVSGVLNLGDRTKNAGGNGHRTPSILYGKAFTYEVVVMVTKNILFPYFDVTQPMAPGGTVKHGLPKTEAWSLTLSLTALSLLRVNLFTPG